MEDTFEIAKTVRRIREKSFGLAQQRHEYYVRRGLYKSDGGGEGYLDVLPKWEGMQLDELIEQRIKLGKEPVMILDIGCGRGKFLRDCVEKWGDEVQCEGITSYPYHSEYPANDKITIKEGDAQRLTNFFPRNKYDIVTAVFIVEYVSDPWITLKRIYEVLKPGGIGLINRFPLSSLIGSKEERDLLIKHLSEKDGIVFENFRREWGVDLCDVGFCKKSQRLQLPLTFVGSTQVSEPAKGHPVEILTYKLDKKIL
jgi:SAM-dependent methyltransferase